MSKKKKVTALARRSERPPLVEILDELDEAREKHKQEHADFAEFLAGASERTLEGVRLAKLNAAANSWSVIIDHRDVIVSAVNAMAENLAAARVAEIVQKLRFARPCDKRGR